MVHDRRIDGDAHIFGNAGGLYINAMTWYDHETESIWSQPLGQAIDGSYRGTSLFLLPSQLTTWGSWVGEHPDSLVMINDVSRVQYPKRFTPTFVIGLTLGEDSKAYYYQDVETAVIINDAVGDVPVMLWAADNNFHAYIRQVDQQTLTFRPVGDQMVDTETNSVWDITLGLAISGPLKGKSLQPVPSLSSFDWAWLDFYPDSTIYAQDSPAA